MQIINVKRIRNLKNYSSHIADNETIYVGLEITEEIQKKLQLLGFTDELKPGELVTPSHENGPVSRFNAFGRDISQKDQPKEASYTPVWWEWKDWSGRTYSEVRYRKNMRFPKLHIDAPSVPLIIIEKDEVKFVVAGESVIKGVTEDKEIIHRINLMLENFAEAQLMKNDMQAFEMPEKLIRLNWEVLPQGDMPWEKFQEHLGPVLQKASERGRKVIHERLEKIASFNPDFRAIGVNGYKGYIIFGFEDLDLYICESAMYGNATYVFENSWEQFSQLTKAEIINSDLYRHRLIHQEGWEKQIQEILRPTPIESE